MGVARALAGSSDFELLGEQSSQKMGDLLSWTPMNCCTKYDAASFVIGREIRRRTNTQTVADIFTLCLSACVDNNGKKSKTVQDRDAVITDH